MNLFDHDYTKLTKEEEDFWRKRNQTKMVFHNDRELPDSILHYRQIFPNNFLNPRLLTEQKKKYKDLLIKFKELFEDESLMEREILNFIRDNQAYFIVGSISKNYRFGHHGLFLFKEFPLGTSYKSDFLLVGQNSEGFHFVFVEFESPYGQISTKKGSAGGVIRKGIDQVNDWEHWLEANYSCLKEVFNKYKREDAHLPDEFLNLDRTRIYFVVVAGQRKNFSESMYRLRRKLDREQSILLLHYGNIIMSSKQTLGGNSY